MLLNFPWPSCRPDTDLKASMTPEAFARVQAERTAAFDAWYAGRRRSGLRGTAKVRRLAEVGAVGVVTALVPSPCAAAISATKISGPATRCRTMASTRSVTVFAPVPARWTVRSTTSAIHP